MLTTETQKLKATLNRTKM